MNVRFEYLYRDAGNFKNWGEIVFINPRNIPIETISKMADEVLIDHANFVAEKASVPDLHFRDYDYDLDHGWHELHSFSPTLEPASDLQHRSVEEFINSLSIASKL